MGSWDPRVQISDPPAPGAAQMLRETVCAGLEKLGQGTSQRGGEGALEGEGSLEQRGEVRTGHFRAPITLVVGQSLRHGPQHHHPQPGRWGRGQEGLARAFWDTRQLGLSFCPGIQPLTPLYPVLGELGCPRVRAGLLWLRWFPDQEACGARAPAMLKDSPSSFPGVCGNWGWQASWAGRSMLGGVTGEAGVRGGHWRFPGACHQHKLNRFDADALVRAQASASDPSHLLV